MVLEGGLFYAGTLTVVDAEALLYGVSVDGQRGSRPHLLPQEDLINAAVAILSPRHPPHTRGI